MSGDVGRLVSILMAVVMVVLAPIEISRQRTAAYGDTVIENAAREFTAKAQAEGAVTLGAYEELLATLPISGCICDVELLIGRSALNYSKNGMALCGAHVHTSACYAGHNHAAEGCAYHEHSSECFCNGKMTHCYRSESGHSNCGWCGGSGVIQGATVVCSKCNGEGSGSYMAKCNRCNKRGMEMEFVTCTRCGGSGVTSKGRECSTCGGTGWEETYITCTLCGGAAYYEMNWRCSECNATGYITEQAVCGYCDGRGGWDYSENYYDCAVCGRGSTTTYGQVCGACICGHEKEGYECGIDVNDTHPLCDRIITDATYNRNQSLYVGDAETELDRCISVRYMNGTEGTVFAVVDIPNRFDTSVSGDYVVNLSYTGYYLSADGYSKKLFPVHLTVLPKGKVCSKCGNFYYFLKDGSDGGCPYCYHGVTGIRVECLKDTYVVGEELQVRVYAVSDLGEEQIPAENVWDTFDNSVAGIQTVTVGYEQHMEQLTVKVIGEAIPEGTVTPVPGEETSPTYIPGPRPMTPEYPRVSPTLTPTVPREHYYGAPGTPQVTYDEILSTDDVMNALKSSGRINLGSGDCVSIRIKVRERTSRGGAGGIFSRRMRDEYTSGVVIP